MIWSFTIGCSRMSLAVFRPNAVTRANFSRRLHLASLSLAVSGSIVPAATSEWGGVVEGLGVKFKRSVVEGSMR